MSTETNTVSADDPVDPEEAIARSDGTRLEIWDALRTVQDPELPLSVVDLGLIYGITLSNGRAEIDLSLTYSGCPAKDIIIGDIKRAVFSVDGVDEVDVTTVYSPPWDYDRITDRGQRKLADWGISVPGYEETPDPDCHE